MRTRIKIALVALGAALVGATGALLVEALTSPSVCYRVEDGRCVYEITPQRGDRATVYIDIEGQPYRHVTVDEDCLRPGGRTVGCPAWLVDDDGRW